MKPAYTLIELLIVIAIFGITISIVTASYLTFERNQRFKNASTQLKNDLRYAQNKALTGDKSLGNSCNNPGSGNTSTLVGWFVNIKKDIANNSTYAVSSDCAVNGSETTTLLNGVPTPLPRGVTICGINSGFSEINVLFTPLSQAPNFYLNPTLIPPFLKQPDFTKLKDTNYSGTVYIYLMAPNTVCGKLGTYKVVILQTGEINEVKLTTNEL